MLPEAPQDQEHRKPHDRLVELRRVHRDHLRHVGASGELHPELLRHDRRRARRSALGKLRRKEAGERTAVVVTHGPAARAAHGIAGRDADAGHVGDLQEIQLLVADRGIAQRHRTDEAAPEHKAAAAEEGRGVAREHDVVGFRPEQRADQCREHDVWNRVRLGVLSTAPALALTDDLRNHERHEDGESESGQFEKSELEHGGVVDDGVHSGVRTE